MIDSQQQLEDMAAETPVQSAILPWLIFQALVRVAAELHRTADAAEKLVGKHGIVYTRNADAV